MVEIVLDQRDLKAFLGQQELSRTLAGRFRLGLKDGFDWLLEHSRNIESERETGIIFSDLNGVHGLPRHPKVRGKVRLRPVTLGAQNSKTVLHLLG